MAIGTPVFDGDALDACESARVARADLCGRVVDPGTLEARHVGAIELKSLAGDVARNELDFGQICNVERRIPGKLRGQEERDRLVRRWMCQQLDALGGGPPHDVLVLRVAQHAKVEIAAHVDVAEAEARVEPRMGALGVEIVVVTRVRIGEHVAVAGAVDDDVSHERKTALLAFEDYACDGVVLFDRREHPAMHKHMDLCLPDDVMRDKLENLGIDGGRPLDGTAQGRSPHAPVCGFDGVLRAPDVAFRAECRVLAAAVHDLLADARDDEVTLPVGHAVDPRDEAARRQSAQAAVTLDENDIGAFARRGHGRGRPGRPAADDEYVALTVDRSLSRRLGDRAVGRSVHDQNNATGTWKWRSVNIRLWVRRRGTGVEAWRRADGPRTSRARARTAMRRTRAPRRPRSPSRLPLP